MNEGQCKIKINKEESRARIICTRTRNHPVFWQCLASTSCQSTCLQMFKELTFAQLCNANRPVAYLVSTWPDV